MKKITESKLQQQCFMWHWNTHPDERGRLWMQYNNPKNRAHGAVLKGMGLVAGVSDLAYLKSDGTMLFIELKLPGQKQGPKQIWWEQLVTKTGAEYKVINNLEAFKKLIHNTGQNCAEASR
jgi:hypothetical protein